MTLLISNLNTVAVKTAEILQRVQAQDQAITALLLLQRQVESAGLTECVSSTTAIHNVTNSLDFATLAPYQVLVKNNPLIAKWHLNRKGNGQMLGDQALLLHQRVQTFYVDSIPLYDNLSVPDTFAGETGDFIMIDDCHQALLSTIQHVLDAKKNKTLVIAGFTAANYHYPISISLVRNRMYYLGKTNQANSPQALYRSDHNKRREQILPQLSVVHFSEINHQLKIEIQSQTDMEPYYVSI